MFTVHIVTLFPEVFPAVFAHSILGRALERGIWSYVLHDLRTFGMGKHKKVDDRPFGGGAGMLLSLPPLVACLESLQAAQLDIPLLALSPGGETFTQEMAQNLAKEQGMFLLCGHYEGVDERLFSLFPIQKISMGDYVVTGGEVASIPLIDAVIRLLGGAIGNAQSLKEESFSSELFGGVEYPQYTKPRNFRGYMVPDILLSGNHKNIQKWRMQKSFEQSALKKNKE